MRLAKLVLLSAGIPAIISIFVGFGIHARLAVAPPAAAKTLADALRTRHGTQLVEMIRTGADPRQRFDITIKGIAEQRPVSATLLLIAVVQDDTDFARLLTSMGIPWTVDERRDAYCVAAVLEGKTEPILRQPGEDAAGCIERLERLTANR